MHTNEDANPSNRPPEAYLAYQIKVAEHLIRQLFERRLRNAGVESSFASLAVLTVLTTVDKASGAELARRSLVTPQTMNGILRGLQAQRLVREGLDPLSARSRLWQITPQGKSMLAAAQQALSPTLLEIDEALGPGKKMLEESLATLVSELQRLSADQ